MFCIIIIVIIIHDKTFFATPGAGKPCKTFHSLIIVQNLVVSPMQEHPKFGTAVRGRPLRMGRGLPQETRPTLVFYHATFGRSRSNDITVQREIHRNRMDTREQIASRRAQLIGI